MKKNCPACGEETTYGQHTHFPFCSRRCRQQDFLDWHEERPRISTPIEDADQAESDLFD